MGKRIRFPQVWEWERVGVPEGYLRLIIKLFTGCAFFFCFRTWLGGRYDQAVHHCRIRVRSTPGLLEGYRSCSVKKSLLG